MEYCHASFSTLGHVYAERLPEKRSGIWHMLNRSVNRAEVICPEPRRMIRAPFIADGCNRLFSMTKGVLPTHTGESFGILDFILCKDDLETEHESPSQMGFFCGSPPVRTSNPVIYDSQFQKQAAQEASPGNHPHPLGGNLTLAISEKAAPASPSPVKNSHGSSASRADAEDSPGTSPGRKPPVVKMERASPSCGSAAGGNPKVRIEGFASGNSDSHCVVPAMA